MFVVVFCVLEQQDHGVGLDADQNMVEQFSAEGADEALADYSPVAPVAGT
ncbi:hypothetical protein [Streptomyces fractus]